MSVQEVTRNNKELDKGEGLEWLLRATKDSKGITWKVMTWNKMSFHQMMSNRKCFQHESVDEGDCGLFKAKKMISRQ